MLPGTHYFHGNTDERKHAAELVGEWVKQKV